MIPALSTLITGTVLSGLAGLVMTAAIPVEPVPVRHDGFDCVVFVKPPGMFMACADTALTLAWRSI